MRISYNTGWSLRPTLKNDMVPQAFTNSASRVTVTSPPTRIPPVSRAAFQFRPKSLRLILVVAETPTRVLPQGSLLGGVGPSTAKRTLRVTPRMVSAFDCQFSVADEADARGLEVQGGKLFNIEEIRALEMRVTLAVTGFDRGSFDGDLDA